jgi:hypothetical protein
MTVQSHICVTFAKVTQDGSLISHFCLRQTVHGEITFLGKGNIITDNSILSRQHFLQLVDCFVDRNIINIINSDLCYRMQQNMRKI